MSDKTISRIAMGIAALAVLFTVVFIADLFGLIPTKPFWENLFAGILAGLVVISLVGLFLPLYLRALYAPQIELEPEADFKLSRYFDDRLKGTLKVNLCNKGLKTIRSFYWHLIIPRGLNPVVQDLRGRIIGARKVGEYEYIRGLVDNQPVFPSSAFELPIMISLDTADTRTLWTIKYALTTEYGHFPKEMELHRLMDTSALADCAEFFVQSEAVKEGVQEETQSEPQTSCNFVQVETLANEKPLETVSLEL